MIRSSPTWKYQLAIDIQVISTRVPALVAVAGNSVEAVSIPRAASLRSMVPPWGGLGGASWPGFRQIIMFIFAPRKESHAARHHRLRVDGSEHREAAHARGPRVRRVRPRWGRRGRALARRREGREDGRGPRGAARDPAGDLDHGALRGGGHLDRVPEA